MNDAIKRDYYRARKPGLGGYQLPLPADQALKIVKGKHRARQTDAYDLWVLGELETPNGYTYHLRVEPDDLDPRSAADYVSLDSELYEAERTAIYRQYRKRGVAKHGAWLLTQRHMQLLVEHEQNDLEYGFIGIVVTLCYGNMELGAASLWGIEHDVDDTYAAEIVFELMSEARDEAYANMKTLCAKRLPDAV